MKKQGIAVSSSIATVTTRPPTRSVSMPAGSRQSEPLSTATALIQAQLRVGEPELLLDRHAEDAEHQPDREHQGEREGRHREHPLGPTGDVAPTGIRDGRHLLGHRLGQQLGHLGSSIWMKRIL